MEPGRDLGLGDTVSLSGCVTRLNALGPTGPGFAETMLGFRAGFLAAGYYIALLKEQLRPADVQFGGGTQFSGARIGLPLSTPEADSMRPLVHDVWKQQHGERGIDRMQRSFASDPDNLKTFRRIIKVLSLSKPIGSDPSQDWPPGLRAPQYILRTKHRFLIAAKIDTDGMVETADGWTESITEGSTIQNRLRLYRYLQQA